MVVAGGVGQPGVELVGLGGVSATATGSRRAAGTTPSATDRLAHLVAVDGGLRGEPRRVATPGTRRTGSAPTRKRWAPRSRRIVPSHGRGTRYCLRAATSNASDISAEEHDEVQAGPLCRAGQSEQHPGAEPPPSHAEPRSPRGLGDAALEQRDVHPLAHLVAVDDQRAERRPPEERQEAVEQRGAGRHEADAVGDQQQPGDPADQRRAADPPDDPGHQRDQMTPSTAPVNRQPSPL